ncbi:hypothetical protein ACFYP4_13995 [Streptomyces sp. NPDC005551]|uniref:hypothetical protein n=1 Tax=unclassified Streptomyces TaxID=2593676 RepID=UPI0033FA6D6B
MAQAAPTSGAPHTQGRAGRSPGTDRTSRRPDVFGARAHIAVPVLLGLVYGFWAAQIRRDAGAVTAWNVIFGIVCAIAFTALWFGIRATAPRLRREPHALLWAVFAGVSIGFLHSQSHSTLLWSVLMAVAVTAGVFVAMFYRYYTHEDAQGRPDPR